MISNIDFAAIAELDLDPIKVKLMHKESGEGWALDYANKIEVEYRRFLYLAKMFPEQAVPADDVDTFWHYHILDTMKYAADCDSVFGYFLHHFPYVGMRGEEDEAARQRGANRMRQLYEETFGAHTQLTAAYCEATMAAAYCEATRPAAYCEATTAAAYCEATRPAATCETTRSAAYCEATRPAAYCEATRTAAYCEATRTAAYCEATRTAAYCEATRPAAYCEATRSAATCETTRPAAYCEATRPAAYCEATRAAAYCEATRPAAYCEATRPAADATGLYHFDSARPHLPASV